VFNADQPTRGISVPGIDRGLRLVDLPAIFPRPRNLQLRRFLVLALILCGSVILGGCDTGHRNIIDNTAPPPVASDFPLLSDISPSQGKPGDEITLNGVNFSPNISENVVIFANSSNTVRLAGLVTSVNVGAFDPDTGAPSTLSVVIPGGVRTGTVSLNVLNATYGDPAQLIPDTFAGARGFTAAPELIGWAVNDDGNGTLIRDAAGNVFPDFVYLYGYNLTNAITDVQIYDGTTTLTADSIIAGPPATASYSLPPGIQMVGVEVPSGLIPGGDTAPLRMIAINGSTGGIPLTSSEIDVPWRFLFGPGDPSDMPAYIAGAILPQGIRRGDVSITCNLINDPPTAIWTLVPEYLSDPQVPNSWVDCTLAVLDVCSDSPIPALTTRRRESPSWRVKSSLTAECRGSASSPAGRSFSPLSGRSSAPEKGSPSSGTPLQTSPTCAR